MTSCFFKKNSVAKIISNLLILVTTFSLVPNTGASGVSKSSPNRVLIKSFTLQSLSSLDSQDLNLLGAIQIIKTVGSHFNVVRYAAGISASEASRILMQSKSVLWAQPDYLLSLPFFEEKEIADYFWTHTPLDQVTRLFSEGIFSSAKDPVPALPPALPTPGKADPLMKEIWGVQKIQADKVWAQQIGSPDIIVADIDTGVDYNHPDLINNMWRNPNPTMNDIVGYDFVNKDAFPFDDLGHGTHTSGTIGATGNNGVGISGVAQKVSIMALKFLGGQEGQGTTSDAIECMDYAIKHGAHVINASWGGYISPEDIENKVLIEAVERVEKANILFVAAAGNDGRDIGVDHMLPGGIKNPAILTVASTTVRDTRSFFSNYSIDRVHVAAPGSDIYSTVPGATYKRFSGTSMATPHVAGLAALILSERPDLSAVDVKKIILSSVDPLDTLKGKIETGGRVNAKVALERARTFGL